MKNFLVATLILLPLFVFSQDENANVVPYKTAKYNHYIGLQSNLLFKQFFNLNSNNSSTVNNPYLLVYAMNNKVNGRGLRVSAGFNFVNDESSDGVTSVETKDINFSGRFGYEKKYHQDKKWVFSFAAELVAIALKNTTTTNTNSITPSFTKTEVTKLMTGINLGGTLAYKLGEHVLIGTETNLNFLLGISKTSISSDTFFNTSESKLPLDIGIKVPTAIYLIVKL